MAAKKKRTKKGARKASSKSKPKSSTPKSRAKSASKQSRSKKAQPTSRSKNRSWLPLGLVGVAAVGAVVFYSQSGGANGTRPETTETVQLDNPPSPVTTVPEALEVRVVQRRPHDRRAFTQGLLFHEGKVFESTGLEGRSSLRRVTLDGEVEAQVALDGDVFAEGLARVGNELFQITWQNEEVFVYDLRTLERVRSYEYEGEGWGLCFDGTHLVMSDGSDTLVFRDPETFAVQREVRVTRIGRPVRSLNELECVDGKIYANIWQREQIVRIDPTDGRVTATIEARGLLERDERRGADVLNGIAHLPDSGHFLLTGKLWPWTFEVEFVARE